MLYGAGEEASRAACGVEQNFSWPGVDALRHERSHGAGRVVFTCIAGALQVVKDLLIDVAEMLLLRQIIEVHLIDFIDDLAHELAGLHVVVGVLEHIAHNTTAICLLSGDREFLELGEEFGVDEGEQLFAGDALRVGSPRAPTELFWDGRAVALLHQLHLLVLVIDDLEEKHPAELGDALGIAVHA